MGQIITGIVRGVKKSTMHIVTQMWMNVLSITEAAVHTPTAPTHLEALPVIVCPDTLATDSTAQVISFRETELFLIC